MKIVTLRLFNAKVSIFLTLAYGKSGSGWNDMWLTSSPYHTFYSREQCRKNKGLSRKCSITLDFLLIFGLKEVLVNFPVHFYFCVDALMWK